MKEFEFEIRVQYNRFVTVEADSAEEALALVKEQELPHGAGASLEARVGDEVVTWGHIGTRYDGSGLESQEEII